MNFLRKKLRYFLLSILVVGCGSKTIIPISRCLSVPSLQSMQCNTHEVKPFDVPYSASSGYLCGFGNQVDWLIDVCKSGGGSPFNQIVVCESYPDINGFLCKYPEKNDSVFMPYSDSKNMDCISGEDAVILWEFCKKIKD